MLETLTKESWTSYLNHAFKIDLESESLAMELVEVSGLGEKPGADREPYSLVFRGPAQPVFEQGLIELKHQELGALALFLVPIGPDSQGMCYEAVFT